MPRQRTRHVVLPAARTRAVHRHLSTAAGVLVAVVLVFASTRSMVLAALALIASGYLFLLALLGRERVAILTLVLAFASAPMYKGLAPSEAATVTPTDLLLVLGVILLVPTVITKRLELPLPYVVGIVLFVVMGLSASALSEVPTRSLFDVIQFIFVAAVLPVTIGWWRPSPVIVIWLAGSYAAGQVISALYGFATGPMAGLSRYAGLSHHPNAFAEGGMMAFALLLFLLSRTRTAWTRMVVMGSLVISAASVVMSGSRAATLVVAALVLMVPVVERSAVWGFLLAIGGALGLAALPVLVNLGGEGSALARLTGTGDAVRADNARLDVLKDGLERLRANPLTGDGFGEVELYHNVFVAVAVATGIFGLLGFLFILYSLARPLFADVPDRRLAYTTWAFIGLGPSVPGLEDRTLWVPMVLAIMAAISMYTAGGDQTGAPHGAEHERRADVAVGQGPDA